jgi:D-3-phosphoglycerate dehydrogenase / 2-oxoglutarate reductase
MLKKVLITDSVHPILIEGLESDGFQCDYQPSISLDAVRKIIGDYEGLIVNSKILVDRMMLDKAPKLQFVGRLGSGMEIIDQEYAAEKGVAVLSAPEGNCNAVAEHALGMLLTLANKLLQGDREVRQKIWQREENRGFEIMGKTVAIIGFGHTGSAFAKKLSGMDVKILAYDKYKTNYTSDYPFIKEVAMQSIFEQADIISFHLPLTDETKHLVDRAFIKKCKNGVIFINTSRGQVIKTEDLIKGLESGNVGGVCLDVFEKEKPDLYSTEERQLFGQLFSFKNTVFSPHVAGWTVESKRRLADILLNKIRQVLKHAN